MMRSNVGAVKTRSSAPCTRAKPVILYEGGLNPSRVTDTAVSSALRQGAPVP